MHILCTYADLKKDFFQKVYIEGGGTQLSLEDGTRKRKHMQIWTEVGGWWDEILGVLLIFDSKFLFRYILNIQAYISNF